MSSNSNLARDERARLARLRALGILDSAAEELFDALARAAAQICGTPIALVSLIDAERQWFKANVGLGGVTETPRDVAFCAHAIRSDEVMVVEDAATDPRFAHNPLVVADPAIRFYAGAPITLSDGLRMGTLCVIDQQTRQLSTEQYALLQLLAASVAAALEMRERGLGALDKALTAQARIERLYQTTPAMLHAADSDFRIVAVSDTWLAKLGYRREEVIGRRSLDFLSEDSRDYALTTELPAFFRSGHCADLEFQMVHKDGSLVDVAWSSMLERDNRGEPQGIVTVIQDITARKHADRRVLESHDRLSRLIEATNAGTWEWDLHSGATRYNSRWAEMLGYQLSELEPTTVETWESLIHPDDLARARALYDRHFAGELAYFDCEFRMRHKDGQWIWIRSRARYTDRDGQGRPLVMAGTLTDITVRKSAEFALLASKQALERTGRIANVGGWELDLEHGVLSLSEQTCTILAIDPRAARSLDEVLGFFPATARAAIEQVIEQGSSHDTPFDLEVPLTNAEGRELWARITGEVESSHGEPVRLVGAFNDVTRNRVAELALAESRELLQVTLESIGDAVITTDLAGAITWLNPVAERLTGWRNVEAQGQPLEAVFNIINEETRQAAENPVARCLQAGKIAGLASHTVLISRHGPEYAIEDSASPIRDRDGQALGAVLVFHDVTEQRRLSREMSYRATHDVLTGLTNRTEFELRLKRVLARAHEDASTNALMYIDLDQFKIVNDSCGHAVGDQLLKQLSALLNNCVRKRDTLARLGGDEFGVILEHCSVEQAERVAQQICDAMDDFRFFHDGKRYRVGTSIGLVPVNQDWPTPAAVMQAADTGCYAAKEAGRNRVHVWRDEDQAMLARHSEMQWTSRIELALDEDRFELYAQRIVPLKTKHKGFHCEILLRMRDADGTMILPGAFLPAAERYHLASRIDRHVVRKVFEWLGALNGASADIATVAVNLSGHSIGDRAFHRFVAEMVASARFKIDQLCFEITETAVVTHLDDARTFIMEMRDLGVRMALDDFGAGASSFGYLKALPVNYLKIDGQFIRDLITDPLDLAAVRCFIEVAKVVGIETVAEFIETEAVLTALREMGVDFAQGYLLHRPEPLANLINAANPHPPHTMRAAAGG